MLNYFRGFVAIALIFLLMTACNTADEDIADEEGLNDSSSIREYSSSENSFSLQSKDESVASEPDDYPVTSDESDSNDWHIPVDDPEDSSSQDDFHKTQEEAHRSYMQEQEKSEKLEAYLRSTLSDDDHGGIFLKAFESVVVGIWVINPEAINCAIDSYPGELPVIEVNTGKCSLATMERLSDSIKKIPLNGTEFINVYISEWDNSIAVNISPKGESRLRKEIDAILRDNPMPEGCFYIYVLNPEGPDPVT